MRLPDCANAARVQAALRLLLEAHEYARDVQCSSWDFGVEISILERAGSTNSDLRWLLCKGFAEHATESRSSRTDRRRFRPTTQRLAFSAQSVFILTAAGAAFARELLAKQTASSLHSNSALDVAQNGAARHIPYWDRARRELSFGGSLVKRFKLPSPNQEAILQAFEEEQWPCRIDDPLPPHREHDAKQRLHDTIKNLNRRHVTQAIRFLGDGSGQGIRWTMIEVATATRAVP
jgi:hypothetical protein